MPQPFTRADLAQARVRLLRDGRAANACVSCVTWQGKDWTVKDFSSRPWWVRYCLAPLLMTHELNILRRLHDVEGVAGEAFLVDRFALAIRFLPGQSLSRVKPEEVTEDFLQAMETLLTRVHAKGIVHLDTRGTGNWLVSPEGRPLLIDFQAAVSTRCLPASWRRILELVDMSGVYKKWHEWQPQTMGPEREALYAQAQKWRSRWKLKGYFGRKKKAGDNKFGS